MTVFEKSRYYSDEILTGETYGLPVIIVRALRARGITSAEEASRFLHPSEADFLDPYLLPDMDKAVERIRLALDKNESICIFGDYDVDGICATSMLVRYFRSLGARISYHIPSRREEGYGMNPLAITKLRQDGVDLIITVDNGISATGEIAYCRELGMDVIVTDHHIPGDELPECTAVVCHTVPNSPYPSATLCGTGIAFKLLHALAGLDAAMEEVALAGLATVADVVPLTGENRALVKLGLDALSAGRCPPGLSRLTDSIPNIKKPYDSFNLGFAVAPRLNASGRMSDASLAVELFLESDTEKMDAIICELNRLNEMRQQEEAGILDSAVMKLSGRNLSETRAIVLRDDSWNPGVIGIAASRLSEMFNRPTILFSENEGVLKGSARSIDGVNIHSALTEVSQYFERFGGHAKAAGVTMKAEHFDDFARDLESCLAREYPNSVFIPRKKYEFEIGLEDIDYSLVEDIRMLAPFGDSNPSLVFRARHVLISNIKCFGSSGQHVRMNMRSGSSSPLEAVWFGGGTEFDKLVSAASVDVLFTVDINRRLPFSGLQLKLIAVNSELPEDKHAYVIDNLPRFCSSFVENHCYRCHEDISEEIRSDFDLAAFCEKNLSGLLILVFSPDGAERILHEIEDGKIGNLSVCYSKLSSSPACSSSVLIAPMLHTLPRSGYSKVVFYDAAPTPGVYHAVGKMMPNAELFLSSAASADYSSVACEFDCSRDTLGSAFKLVRSKLDIRPYSFGELVTRTAQEMRVPPYFAEFAVSIFFDLDFLRMNENCAITMNPDYRCRRLTDSALYSEILNLREK